MDAEKFKLVLDYFTSNGITLPTEVQNAIQDVFEENDNIDSVNCYHKEDIGEIRKDLHLRNNVRCDINGSSKGELMSTWSYYGAVEFALSEKIYLVEGESILEVISEVETGGEESYFYDEKDYAVILLETTKWETPGNLKKEDVLYIYCPKSLDETGDADEYADIYKQFRGELDG